jgi:hypothetical protein
MKILLKTKLGLLFLLLSVVTYGNNNSDVIYRITINQLDTNFHINLHVLIPATDQYQDTVVFLFGGLVPLYSIDELQVKSGEAIWFDFHQEKRILKLLKKDIVNHTLQFGYLFNPVWGAMYDSTVIVVENQVEYPVPIIHGLDSIRISADIHPQNDCYVLSNIPINKSSLTKIDLKKIMFLFLDKNLFKQISFSSPYCSIHIHTANGSHTNDDFNRLEKKINGCIDYFSNHIAPYRYSRLDIVEMNWYGSTYQDGLAVVATKEFKTYTLFHELTHEWIGGIISIKENSDGEFLIRESLNEYLNLQYLRHAEGDSLYRVVIDKYSVLYNDFLKDNADMTIMSIKKYVHSTHPIIMYKQVILLDKLAKKIGYEEFNNSIFQFLRSRIGQLTETFQFLDFLQKTYGIQIENYLKAI